MDDLIKRIEEAKINETVMNELVADYLPLMKKETHKYESLNISYDDRLSMAMLVFVNCIKQYDSTKGNFLTFLSKAIKYRFIDQQRAESKNSKLVYFDSDYDGETNNEFIDNQASMQQYEREKEQDLLKIEIENLNDALKNYSLSFRDLEKNCPKQKRSRLLCMQMANTIVNNSSMRTRFEKTGNLPQTEVALMCGVSIKSVEKYRKYIVALVILLIGDYPAIRSFIPIEIVEK